MSSAGSSSNPARLHRRVARLLATPERVTRACGRHRLDGARDQILAALHTQQRRFATDPSLFIAALVGRGGGKTTGQRARFLLRMISTQGARCLYVATTRSQAEEFMWVPLKELNEALGLGAIFSESKLQMTLPQTGATLRLVGADDKREIEKLRGQPFHEVAIDEAASHLRQLFEHLVKRIIMPRLGDYDGTLVVYGTPGHVLDGMFYDITRVGSTIGRDYAERADDDEWLGWSVHRWSLQDGAAEVPALDRLWRRALLNKRLEGWTDDNPVWRREYLGLWAADDTEMVFRYRPHLDTGEPWNQWDPARLPNGFAALDDDGQGWRYFYAIDMGSSDPFALVVLGNNGRDRNLRHVYEHTQRGITPRGIAELLLGREYVAAVLAGQTPDRPGGVIGHTGWPESIVADLAGLGGAILDELREVYGITVKPANKRDKLDSIELTNGDLLDGRLTILKGSELEAQMLTLQWDVDDWGRLKERRGDRNDATDACIYARREAMHVLTEAPPAAAPERGSAEEAQRWIDEDETRAAGETTADPYADLLTDATYFDDWY